MTALMLAAGFGRDEVVKEPVASHADINEKKRDGQTVTISTLPPVEPQGR
jgi:ankyrin repeat protein